jgi:hypothetical protein
MAWKWAHRDAKHGMDADTGMDMYINIDMDMDTKMDATTDNRPLSGEVRA